MTKGKVYLIGAGPGDIGLFTLKGKEILEKAEVVLYDALVSSSVLSYISADAERIYVGKRSSNHTLPQEDINKLILKKALEGKIVARLKGGDPFLFGRGGEELELICRENIDFEIVPGITSAISVPAYAGIPVTHREFVSSLHIITGHTKEHEGSNIDFESLVKLKGTLVFLMGISSLSLICKELIKNGMSEHMPCAIIENGTRGTQRTIVGTISDIYEISQRENVKAPAIILVGEVSTLSKKFSWREKLSFFGKKIVVTRPRNLNSRVATKLREFGAEVVEVPTIRTEALSFSLKNIDFSQADVLAFTSYFGVKVFFDKLIEEKIDIRKLANVKFAAIGKMTADEISKYAVNVDFVPNTYNGEALGHEIVTDGKVLIFRAQEGSSGLTDVLTQRGIEFSDIPVYKTMYEEIDDVLIPEILTSNLLTFTSASTVKAFVSAVKNSEALNIPVLCIGEQTAQMAREYGFKNIEISEKATVSSMIDYIKCNLIERV